MSTYNPLKKRSSYFHAPSSKDTAYVVMGNGGSYDGHEYITKLSWSNEQPIPHDSDTHQLVLDPTVAELKKLIMPTGINNFKKLKYISLPFPVIPHLQSELLPQTLTSIQINYTHELTETFPVEACAWPTTIQLPRIKGLYIHLARVPATAWKHLQISGEHLPNLQYITCTLDGNAFTLNWLKQFEQLKYAELYHVKKLNIFEALPKNLECLSIGGLGPQFPLENIVRLSKLRGLRINGATVRREIDCSLFARLDNLVELDIMNCKKITHIETLLQHPTLQTLRILNSKNPFNEELQTIFKNHGFAQLDIEHA